MEAPENQNEEINCPWDITPKGIRMGKLQEGLLAHRQEPYTTQNPRHRLLGEPRVKEHIRKI
ncbi:hypothetical protein GCM10027286_37470 [Virgibacillus ainsalahensis]